MTLRERILKAAELNEPEWFARGELAENRRLTPLIQALADVADALPAVLQLIDDQDLVRNTQSDAEFMKFMSQGVRIVNAIKPAQDALSKLEQVVGDK